MKQVIYKLEKELNEQVDNLLIKETITKLHMIRHMSILISHKESLNFQMAPSPCQYM